jgi:hypothetical protein
VLGPGLLRPTQPNLPDFIFEILVKLPHGVNIIAELFRTCVYSTLEYAH